MSKKIKSKLSFINGGESDEDIDENEEIEEGDNEDEIDNEDDNEEENEDDNSDEENYEYNTDDDNTDDDENDENNENTEEEKDKEISEDIITTNNNNNIIKRIVNNNERITNNFMSKYEFTRILGTRTTQIEEGSIVLLKNAEELKKKYNPEQLAILELQNKSCPLYLIREIPNGNIEKWDVNELNIRKEYLRL